MHNALSILKLCRSRMNVTGTDYDGDNSRSSSHRIWKIGVTVHITNDVSRNRRVMLKKLIRNKKFWREIIRLVSLHYITSETVYKHMTVYKITEFYKVIQCFPKYYPKSFAPSYLKASSNKIKVQMNRVGKSIIFYFTKLHLSMCMRRLHKTKYGFYFQSPSIFEFIFYFFT
jgi:hypothetical protein